MAKKPATSHDTIGVRRASYDVEHARTLGIPAAILLSHVIQAQSLSSGEKLSEYLSVSGTMRATALSAEEQAKAMKVLIAYGLVLVDRRSGQASLSCRANMPMLRIVFGDGDGEAE